MDAQAHLPDMAAGPISAIISDMLAYTVGSRARISASWLEAQEDERGEVSAETILTPSLVLVRTQREVTSGLFASGYLSKRAGQVRIRDTSHAPGAALASVDCIARGVDARYTYIRIPFDRFDLYVAQLSRTA